MENIDKIQVSLYLDVRYTNRDGKHPLKIRAWNPRSKRRRLILTGLDLTPDEYMQASKKKPSQEHVNTALKLQAIKAKALKAADESETFDDLIRKLRRKQGENKDVFSHYSERIRSLARNDQPGTQIVYSNAKSSFSAYLKERRGREVSKLSFYAVTPALLNDYEKYMRANGKSLTTVSMYVRTLRTLFNNAITAGDIESEILPFGRGRYVIPNTRNVKKALRPDELRKLMDAAPGSPDQAKARDFWFFSYACNGMNMRDLLSLRWENIKGDRIEYIRTKTKNTKRENMTPVTVQINSFARGIIEKYGTGPASTGLVFPVLSGVRTAQEKMVRSKAFTRYVNQHVKKLAESIGLPPEISTYWARHSFATNVIRQGYGIELLSESLNHGDIKTTQRYIAGFDEEVKKDLAIKIMDF